jgi:DNA-binding NarL/FixJ family response regulator
MTPQLRVLLLEDSEADAELIESELVRSGRRVVTCRVDTGPAFEAALLDFEPDLVISDHALGQFRSTAAVELSRSVRPALPFIVVSGALDEEVAVDALRRGADDYVVKTNLQRLVPAVETALAARQQLRLLTPRQLEVLRLVAEGNTSRQIAAELGIALKTVETHRTALMKRLGIHDLAGLVRYALRVRLASAER